MLPDPDTKAHRLWIKSYLYGRHVYWVIFAVLLSLISFGLDSVARDFAMLFLTIALAGLTLFREMTLKCVVSGRVEEHLTQSGLGLPPRVPTHPPESQPQSLHGLLH